MKPTQILQERGQSLWLDNITRGILLDGTLKRYIREFSITGLTSNPSIYDHAITKTSFYDDAIRDRRRRKGAAEDLFFELAVEDLTQAADLFLPIHQRTNHIDGWVSLELSPLLAYDPVVSVNAATQLHAQARRPNLFIKIPGTQQGLAGVEEAIFRGIPINVTLLFSREQYLAAAEAHARGIERRLAAGKDPKVASVASLFVSRWDKAVAERVPAQLKNRLGIAIAKRTYQAYRQWLASPRWQKLAHAGASPQRLLWASTSTKDPKAPDVLYVEALAAPDTINTMPDETLLAFADHGRVSEVLPEDGGDAESVIAEFQRAGIDDAKLALQLQREGADAFTRSWNDLIQRLEEKSSTLAEVA